MKNFDTIVMENDKKLFINLTKENATNLGRYCHVTGKHVDNCDDPIRQFLEEYLEDTLTPADIKAIEKIINAERKEKIRIEKEEEKESRPEWDKRKL